MGKAAPKAMKVAPKAKAYAGEQDLDDATVGMPSFLENREWMEAAPARLAMVKAKVKAMKAAPKAMKVAPKAKAKKAAPMKASKKAELLQGGLSFTQLALYGLVAAGAFSFGFGFRCKSLGIE